LNVGLLDEGRDRTAADSPDRQPGITDDYSPGAVALARKEGLTENGSRVAKKTPWYRTRCGITTIAIIIILIIGGVVGGAIGGTRHSSPHNSTNIVDSASHTTGASMQGQPAPTTFKGQQTASTITQGQQSTSTTTQGNTQQPELTTTQGQQPAYTTVQGQQGTAYSVPPLTSTSTSSCA
jgi:hypothetical protein